MKPREITDVLAQPGAQDLLATATLLRFAYDGPDGFPRVIPVGFYWTGSQIVVCTATTALYHQMARISIEPVWARFFDFGAGRMPVFLQRLASGAQSAHEATDAA